MHIVLGNRYYSPDVSATAQIGSDLAEQLAAQGHRVQVITSRQRYDDAGALLPRRKMLNHVGVIRIRTLGFGQHTVLGRLMDYISFYLSFAFACLYELEKNSILECCTDQPQLSVSAYLACILNTRQTGELATGCLP